MQVEDRERALNADGANPENAPGVAGDRRLSRRSLTRIGMGVGAVATLANRPAMGAVCSPSGYASFSPGGMDNPSGVRHVVGGCGGYHPWAWRSPYNGGKGSFYDWHAAGCLPNDPDDPSHNCGKGSDYSGLKSYKKSLYGHKSYKPTMFADCFGSGYVSSWATLHDVLLGDVGGGLDKHCAAAYLNACLPIPGYLNVVDVCGLYQAVKSGAGSYTTYSGSDIDLSLLHLTNFIKQTYG